MSSGYRWPLEGGEGKETDSSIAPPERISLAGALTLVQ